MSSRSESARLAGARVAIAGGSRGIGRAIACAVLSTGGRAIIGSRNADERCATRAALGAGAEDLPLDAASEESIRAFIEAARPDHLVISIGAPETPPQPFETLGSAGMRAHFETYFWPAVELSRTFLAMVPKARQRSLLFVTGGLSRKPLPGKSAFTAAQWAIEGLAQALVSEGAPTRVNVLVPGLVRSPRWETAGPSSADEFYAGASAGLPGGEVPGPEAVASTAVEALTNTYLNGAALVVDGGWTSAGAA